MAAKKPPTRQGSLATGVTRPAPDDGLRGAYGVVASLVARSDGTIRLVLDDARRGGDGAWEPTGLFTSRDYPAAQLGALQLEPDELEQLGLALVARLVAIAEVNSRGG